MNESRRSEQPAAGGRAAAPKRIVVVDDDALVRAGTAALLEELGHIAIEAEAAEGALALLGADAAIDIVITDHAMPGTTGAELAARIFADFPGVVVVLYTGYADLAVDDGGGALRRLEKPFRRQDLAALIASISQAAISQAAISQAAGSMPTPAAGQTPPPRSP